MSSASPIYGVRGLPPHNRRLHAQAGSNVQPRRCCPSGRRSHTDAIFAVIIVIVLIAITCDQLWRIGGELCRRMRSRPLMSVHLDTAATQNLGAGPHGTRVIFPITGGSFEGDRLRGKVLPGGADWTIERAVVIEEVL